jgi:hypothetical protein
MERYGRSLRVAAMAALACVLASQTARAEVVVDLMAGQFEDVGSVKVSDDGTSLTVEMTVDEPGWWIGAVHIHVAGDAKDIPQTKKGNPKVGKFDHNVELAEPVKSHTWVTTLPAGPDCYVAAHAEVCFVPIDPAALPADAPFKVLYNPPSGSGYFETTVTDGLLAGTYVGWCVDRDHYIQSGPEYAADAYSSCDPAAATLVDKPENLDLVNWVINQDYVGKTVDGCTFSFWHVQHAIWELIDDNPPPISSPGFEADVFKIVNAALAQGEGFVPQCGEKLAVILAPLGNQQVTIVELLLKCEPACETAWGGGDSDAVIPFAGDSWATYIKYECGGGPVPSSN